jgi:cystathionine beta-lyase
MQYDFDQIIDRKNTDCVKWDEVANRFGNKDILPLWVADMDFKVAPPVAEALQKRAEYGIYGYTIRSNAMLASIQGWQKRRHNWEIATDWLAFTPGVVAGLTVAVLAYTKPGDKIIIQPPIYPPFYNVCKGNDREILENPLILQDGQYIIDFELFEQQAEEASLFLLCSPHNPGGRVWRPEELARLGEICLRHNVTIVSDEIHADVIYAPHKHTPIASLSPELAQHTVTLMAPSKTFNVAGLVTAYAIIPNESLRRRFNAQIDRLAMGEANYFGVTALEACYNEGEEWLEQLLAYLKDNAASLAWFMEANLPQIKVMRPEGTFLVWVDCRALSTDPEEWKQIMYEEAGVAFNEGSTFGAADGAGFLRVNIGCPRMMLMQGTEKFVKAVKEHFSL